MATLSERNPGNAEGRYYVDSSCIDCEQCRVLAPDLFTRNIDTGYSAVARQPLNQDEFALAEEVMAACPTQSIGSDGA